MTNWFNSDLTHRTYFGERRETMDEITIHRQDGNAGLDGYFEVRRGNAVVFEGLECQCCEVARDLRIAKDD